MIKMYTARTSEVDEISEAISEIKSQIDFTALKKHSGGIIFCHMDFIDSGVVEALCKELPFNTIGMTSLASADEHGYSLFELTLTVLTSDEVTFEAGMTNSLTHDTYVDEIDRLYKQIRGKVDSDPAMIFALAPHMHKVSGYEVLTTLDKACGGNPIWGSLTSGVDFNYDAVKTICNGKHLREGLAVMLINGPVEPKFIVASIPERNISNNRAVITKSDGAILHEINDLSVLAYLDSIGLVITKENITTTPLMVYYDGAQAPVAVAFYALFDDGSVLTGGEMSVGTLIAVGSIDPEGIVESVESGLNRILDYKDRQATMILPCVTRYIMLAPDQEKELGLVKERLTINGHPFVMGYSGGELAPMPDLNGKLHNRFHNYTFCACIL